MTRKTRRRGKKEKEERRQAAEHLLKEREKRSDREQLQRLVDRGHAHTREAKRLLEALGLEQMPEPNPGSLSEREGDYWERKES